MIQMLKYAVTCGVIGFLGGALWGYWKGAKARQRLPWWKRG